MVEMGIDRDFLPTILVMSKESLHLLFQILREGLNSFYSHYWSGLPFFFYCFGKTCSGCDELWTVAHKIQIQYFECSNIYFHASAGVHLRTKAARANVFKTKSYNA